MSRSQWHKLYRVTVAAPAAVLFDLLADLPNYGRWLPGSAQFGQTADVAPYPVQLGSRYLDGHPREPGKDWRGTVTGFQPPGCPVRSARSSSAPSTRRTCAPWPRSSSTPKRVPARASS
jgi:hypothetical protein